MEAMLLLRFFSSPRKLDLCGLAALLFFGWAGHSRADYDVPAAPAHDPAQVRVDVSIDAQMVYVMEGDRPLLVTAACSGKYGHRTPLGSFRVTDKDARKRSGEFGFWGRDGRWLAGGSGSSPGAGWSFVGYPMAFWVGFQDGIGFHEGYVWPVPRSHGCIRLPHRVAPKFFALVGVGTPVSVARSQPEDETLGRNAPRPSDYRDPDPPARHMVSDDVFE